MDFHDRIGRIKQAASGQWRFLFQKAGMSERHLLKVNVPCPLCGGVDRFSILKPKNEDTGAWYCRKCGHGDGIALIQKYLNLSFVQTLAWLEEALGLPAYEPKSYKRNQQKTKHSRVSKVQWLWDQGQPLSWQDAKDNPVLKYLSSRGLENCELSSQLRYLPKLPYWSQNENGVAKKLGEYPAMIAAVRDLQGHLISLHRTYLLESGQKAPVQCPKKLMKGSMNGGLIQLFEPTEVLAISEGIETALSVHELFKIPVWSAVSVTGFHNLTTLPQQVQELRIYADNDASYAGIAGAYDLASKLKSKCPQLKISVFTPAEVDSDYNDELKKCAYVLRTM